MVGDTDFIEKVRQMMFFYVFGPIETDSQAPSRKCSELSLVASLEVHAMALKIFNTAEFGTSKRERLSACSQSQI